MTDEQSKANGQQSLEQRKEALRSELKELEQQMDSDFNTVRTEVSRKVDPVEFIKRHPVGTLSAAVLTGFLFGRKSARNKRIAKKLSAANSQSGNNFTSPSVKSKVRSGKSTLSEMIWDELKKHLTKKGTELIMGYLEEKLEEYRQKEEAK